MYQIAQIFICIFTFLGSDTSGPQKLGRGNPPSHSFRASSVVRCLLLPGCRSKLLSHKTQRYADMKCNGTQHFGVSYRINPRTSGVSYIINPRTSNKSVLIVIKILMHDVELFFFAISCLLFVS